MSGPWLHLLRGFCAASAADELLILLFATCFLQRFVLRTSIDATREPKGHPRPVGLRCSRHADSETQPIEITPWDWFRSLKCYPLVVIIQPASMCILRTFRRSLRSSFERIRGSHNPLEFNLLVLVCISFLRPKNVNTLSTSCSVHSEV
jgi:hypothetical protein